MRRVVFLLFPGFEVLDFAGPLQVFYEAVNRGLERELVFSGTAARVVSEQGLTVADLVAAIRRAYWERPTSWTAALAPPTGSASTNSRKLFLGHRCSRTGCSSKTGA